VIIILIIVVIIGIISSQNIRRPEPCLGPRSTRNCWEPQLARVSKGLKRWTLAESGTLWDILRGVFRGGGGGGLRLPPFRPKGAKIVLIYNAKKIRSNLNTFENVHLKFIPGHSVFKLLNPPLDILELGLYARCGLKGVPEHYSVLTERPITIETRMVQLPATAAIEYDAACCRTRTRTRTKIGTITKTVLGAYARSPQGQCIYAPSKLSVPSILA